MKWRRWWSILRLRFRSLVRPNLVERELDKELRFHLERQIEENLARQMTPQAARRAALRSLDGLTTIQEECRDMRRINHIENLRQDLRFTFRSLAKSPGFAAVIILTLALSIGANSAIFSVIDGVLLKPLPYPEPDRIVRIFFANASFPKFRLNPWDFHDFRERNRSFEGFAGFTRRDLQLSGTDQPERLPAILVTAGYFAVLGLKPARGREFGLQDELPGNGRVVVLSDRLWRRRFAADPAILGKKVTLDSLPYTVVGVMPPGSQHPGNDRNPLAHGDTVDAWTPFTFSGNPGNRGSHFVDGIGRLKKGVTPEQALAEMNLLTAGVMREHPDYNNGWHVLVIPLYREIVGNSQRLLLVLLGAVGAVLLIACVNAANLLLARSTARQHEMAIRAALGAGKSRLLSQMLTESVLIALAGACGGAAIAMGGVKTLVALLPADFPRAQAIHVDARVFAFTLLVAISTGLLFGFAPAWQAAKTNPNEALRDGARGATTGRRHARLRGVLVVAEVGLACALLIGAGLMLRSFVNLLRTDPGFRPEHVLTASISLPAVEYKTGESIAHFYDRVVTDLAGLPGVQAAGAGTDIPWSGYNENTSFSIEGRTEEANTRVHARFHGATTEYFRALGIPLVSGRFLTARDNAAAPEVILVNQSLAQKYWPNEEAVGKRVTFNTPPKWVTVVGVVGDVKDTPNSSAAEPAFWWPELQVQPTLGMSIVVRATSEPGPLLEALRQEVRRLNASLAVANVQMMDQVARSSVATPRFSLFLVGLFAFLALTLAGIGMYGVVAYSVGQRTHEFGLRMALGANTFDVQRLVLVHGVRLALAGVGLGVVCALLLAKVLRSLLFGVSAQDPATFAIVSAIAIAVAALACYVPARRATRAEPMSALRCD